MMLTPGLAKRLVMSVAARTYRSLLSIALWSTVILARDYPAGEGRTISILMGYQSRTHREDDVIT